MAARDATLAARPLGLPAIVLPGAVRRLADALLIVMAVSVPLSTTAMEAAVIALGVLALVAAVARWSVVRRTPLDPALALFYGTLAISTVASGHPLEASGWARLWVVLTYFTVFWWLRDRAHAVDLVRWLVAAAAVAAAYGVLQHFTGADWYRRLLGRPLMVHPREAGGEGFATVGFFRNYLTFAHLMLFPFAWAIASARRRWLPAVAAALIAAAIVFSTARGAWLGMAAIGLTVVALGRDRRAAVLVLVLTAGAVGVLVATPDLRREAAAMASLAGSNAGRVGIYRANLDIVHEHPLLGLGFGRYQTAARPYYDRHPEADRRSHAHSNYLHLAAEAGLAGLAAFTLLFATALRRGWSAVRSPDGRVCGVAAGAWAGVIGFLVAGATQYSFGDNEVAIAMWVALAVLMRCR